MAGFRVEEDHRSDEHAANPEGRGFRGGMETLNGVLELDQPVGADEAEDPADDQGKGDEEFRGKAHGVPPTR